MHPDPVEQFRTWFDDASAAGQPEPEAMALATTGSDGRPSVRFVLLRSFDASGFVFYTNRNSRKGAELRARPTAALAFRWWIVGRQVRVNGPVTSVTEPESDEYFATRPRGAQLGAWASAQSEPLDNRMQLERQLREASSRFAGSAVPRPPWWGGYRLHPDELEFWQNQPNRLHDRLVYRRAGGEWAISRLSP